MVIFKEELIVKKKKNEEKTWFSFKRTFNNDKINYYLICVCLQVWKDQILRSFKCGDISNNCSVNHEIFIFFVTLRLWFQNYSYLLLLSSYFFISYAWYFLLYNVWTYLNNLCQVIYECHLLFMCSFLFYNYISQSLA